MRIANLRPYFYVISVLVLGLFARTLEAQQPYRVIDHWSVGGSGGWDYLLTDPDAHLLYVTHGTRVEVLDTLTGKLAGAITGLKGTHGIALNTDGREGYISDGGADAVIVFDRKHFATLATIPVGTNPDGIVFEPVTKTVWVFNGRSRNVNVIDAATHSVLATMALPGKPEFPQADGNGHVFDNIEDKNEVVTFDAATKTLVATWPLDHCESPSGLAMDRGYGRLFSVCDGDAMAVVDAKSGKQLAIAKIGDGPDAAGFDAKDQFAFSSNGSDGTLSVIDAAHNYAVLQSLPTQKGARTMAYDDATDRVYLVTAEFGPRAEPTEANPHPHPAILPGTFTVLVVGRNK